MALIDTQLRFDGAECSGRCAAAPDGKWNNARRPVAGRMEKTRIPGTRRLSLSDATARQSGRDRGVRDDAHAAENYVASHWTVRISRFESADC